MVTDLDIFSLFAVFDCCLPSWIFAHFDYRSLISYLRLIVPSLHTPLTDEVDFHPITSTPVKRGASEPAGKHSLTPSSKSAVEPRSKRHQSLVEEDEEDELGSAGNFELIFFSPAVSLFPSSLERFLLFPLFYFDGDTQREPLRRREDHGQSARLSLDTKVAQAC